MIICLCLGWRESSHDITNFGRTLLNFEQLHMFIQKVSVCPGYCSGHQHSENGYHMMGISSISTVWLVRHRQWSHVHSGLDMFAFLTKSINMDFEIKNVLWFQKAKWMDNIQQLIYQRMNFPHRNNDNGKSLLPVWQKRWINHELTEAVSRT